MKKIGITGSIASGKTTASKILSQRKGPLFSADNIVKKLYSKKSFQKLLVKKFDVHKDLGFKSQIKYNSKGQGYIKIFYDNLEQYDFIVKKIKN